YPGFGHDILDYLVDHQYRGIVIEGTGLGHAPKSLQASVAHAVDAGIVVAMTSQCISGRVDMDVYRTGVELQELGIVACEDMLTETAFVKLSWLLANMKGTDKVKTALSRPYVGEIEMRSEMAEYSTTAEEI
ncbi:MAG: Glu-tRNA(Gln) amidotransferase subunit GatD, partial [Candidatus Thorarchaeota archaeon SMTZ1-45]